MREFDTDEAAVNKIRDIVILMPKTDRGTSFMQAVDMFSADFFENGRLENWAEQDARHQSFMSAEFVICKEGFL